MRLSTSNGVIMPARAWLISGSLAMVVSLLLTVLLGGQARTSDAQERLPVRCSIVNLLASPAEYDGKLVQVIGYARIRFEGNALYLSQADAEHGVTSNGVWLDISDWAGDRKQRANHTNRYVIVEGTFRKAEKGHMGMWPGGIKRIARFDPWPTDAEMQGIVERAR